MEEHNIFTDINNIQVGDIWSNTIENNISTCDIFVDLDLLSQKYRKLNNW